MISSKTTKNFITAMLFAFFGSVVALPSYAQLEPDVQAKVDQYKKKLEEWAANPVLVKAVKHSNTIGGLIAGMSNSQWDEVPETDPRITQIQNGEAGLLLSEWENDTNLSKLYLRDESGNIVACGNNKPLLWNNKTKPPFVNGMKGTWAADKVKPDPTSQIPGVHVSTPVMDAGKVIGVLHTSVVAR